MKGILFVEFINFLEENSSPEIAQDIINRSDVESGGAYSRVGLYDYQELIALLVETASTLEQPADVLLDGYANHLMTLFSKDYAGFFEDVNCAADMLQELDSHIHVEVQKLYPDAELPKFTAIKGEGEIRLQYESPRPLAAVALALTKACISHFGVGEELIEANIAEDQCSAQFLISTP